MFQPFITPAAVVEFDGPGTNFAYDQPNGTVSALIAPYSRRYRPTTTYRLRPPTKLLVPSVQLDQRTLRTRLVAVQARTQRRRRRQSDAQHFYTTALWLSPLAVVTTPGQLQVKTRLLSQAVRTRLDASKRAPHSRIRAPRVLVGSVLYGTDSVGAGSPGLAGLAGIVAPAPVLIREPPWRFVVTTLDTSTLTFLDKQALLKTITFTLNKPAVATGTVASDNPEINITHTDGEPFLAEGVRLLYALRREGGTGNNPAAKWKCRFAGLIENINDIPRGDQPQSVFTAYDPWQLLANRPVRYANGAYPGPNGMVFVDKRAEFIALKLLHNSILNDGPCRIDAGTAYGGTAFYGQTGVSQTACDPVTITFQQGTTVADAWTQLTDTGLIDIVLRPIYDPIDRPGFLCEVGMHPAVGEIRDGAIFAWDEPSHSLIGIDRLEDGTQRANDIQYFAQGGIPVGRRADAGSLAKYGRYWAMKTLPQGVNMALVNAVAKATLLMSKDHAQTVKISPAPERSPIPFTEYNLGDTVSIYASKRLRKPIATQGRVYSIPIQIDDQSIERIQALEFAADSLTPIDPAAVSIGGGGNTGGGGGGTGDSGGGGASFTVTIGGSPYSGDTLNAVVVLS